MTSLRLGFLIFKMGWKQYASHRIKLTYWCRSISFNTCHVLSIQSMLAVVIVHVSIPITYSPRAGVARTGQLLQGRVSIFSTSAAPFYQYEGPFFLIIFKLQGTSSSLSLLFLVTVSFFASHSDLRNDFIVKESSRECDSNEIFW